MRSCIWLWIAAWLALAFVDRAHAASSIAVLGVRSLDGEDGLERRLSSTLRKSAKALGEYTLSDRELSLEQMALAQGCEEPDAHCMAEIAKTLGVERLIYGTVVGGDGGHELTLYTFDASSGRVASAAEHQLPADRLKADGADATVTAVLRRLLAPPAPPPRDEPATGELRVRGDVPGTAILIDGEPRGALDEQGVLIVALSPGKHTVRPADAGPMADRLALVEAGGSTELRLELAPKRAAPAAAPAVAPEPAETSAPGTRPNRSARRTWGWVTLGLGGAFAAATIYSWVRIAQIDRSDDYLAYRAQFPPAGAPNGVANACAAARRHTLVERDPSKAGLEQEARTLCQEADTLQTLQYVFIGGTALSAGLATYLLISSRDRPQKSVSLAPRFGWGAALLEANVRF